ncbi:MAG: hypothetical protein V4515_08115 [Chloroflexota bacterium]
MSLVRGFKGFVFGVPATVPSRTTPVFEDQVRGLVKVRLVADHRIGPRVNLLIPTVEEGRAFAGVRSAVDLFQAVGAHADRRRVVSTGPMVGPALRSLDGYHVVSADGPDEGAVDQLVALDGTAEATLAVGPDDVFIATLWTTAELAHRIITWQDVTYGPAERRFGYVIQDFEPGFYAWSAQWLMARATYDDPARTVAFFNTSLLQQYFHAEGLRFEREFVFEPRLWPALIAAAARGRSDVARVPRHRRIVVYGRPSTPRNAFPLLIDGLRAWATTYPGAQEWSVVSAGQAHPDVTLAPGVVLEARGKLTLDDYADLLLTSSIGLSFMISPHPSFPPLEMAHLGLRVLTNAFAGKDLSTWHQNIESVEPPTPDGIAAALGRLCARIEADPQLGERGESLRGPEAVGDLQFPFAAEAALVLGLRHVPVG